MSDNAIALEILKRARTTLTPLKSWAQGNFASNANGELVSINSDEAVCWCAEGALYKESRGFSGTARDWYNESISIAHKELEKTIQQDLGLSGSISIPTWNDNLPYDEEGHEEVLRVFDLTIQRLSEES